MQRRTHVRTSQAVLQERFKNLLLFYNRVGIAIAFITEELCCRAGRHIRRGSNVLVPLLRVYLWSPRVVGSVGALNERTCLSCVSLSLPRDRTK